MPDHSNKTLDSLTTSLPLDSNCTENAEAMRARFYPESSCSVSGGRSLRSLTWPSTNRVNGSAGNLAELDAAIGQPISTLSIVESPPSEIAKADIGYIAEPLYLFDWERVAEVRDRRHGAAMLSFNNGKGRDGWNFWCRSEERRWRSTLKITISMLPRCYHEGYAARDTLRRSTPAAEISSTYESLVTVREAFTVLDVFGQRSNPVEWPLAMSRSGSRHYQNGETVPQKIRRKLLRILAE